MAEAALAHQTAPTPVTAPLLEVEHLRVRYPMMGAVLATLKGQRNRFLDAVLDVSFTLKAGTTLALVGESGSGKSSLGRAIIGLTPIHSGHVRFQGKEPHLGGGARDYRRDVAMMFQDPVSSLSPRRT